MTVECTEKGAIATTVSLSSTPSPESVVIGDLVQIAIYDDDIVPDAASSDSEGDSDDQEKSPKKAYGVVCRVHDTSVVVIWFYSRSEFLRPYPRGFAAQVSEHTLSTSVSDEISKDVIKKVEKVPDMSNRVFHIDDNILTGDAESILLYYRTLAAVHTRRKETSCTFVDAVDWAITTKQGMFATVGTIKPSEMASTISHFEDTGRALLPHDIGPKLVTIGEFSLPAW